MNPLLRQGPPRLANTNQTKAAFGIGIAVLACGCDQGKAAPSSGTAGRSEVVLSKDAPPAAPSASSALAAASASASASAPKVARRICETELSKPARALPRATFEGAAAPGMTSPDPKLEVGAGHWTWVNFFAAWCVPCREEIPRLKAWEQKLAASLRVRFISLDDDERQLGRFFTDQPANGLKQSLWLKPGASRDGFMQGLKLSESLPAHALVDPAGKVRCAFEGAIDESDFAQVEAIVSRR